MDIGWTGSRAGDAGSNPAGGAEFFENMGLFGFDLHEAGIGLRTGR